MKKASAMLIIMSLLALTSPFLAKDYVRANGTIPSFLPAANYPVGYGPVEPSLGDLNGDNYLDIVTPNYLGSTISVLLNKGDGSFGVASSISGLQIGPQPYSALLGDLNHNGTLDLVVTNYGADNVTVLLGRGDGTFNIFNTFPVGSGPGRASLADLNSDGNLDIIVPISMADCVSVLLGNGDGTFAPQATFPVGSQPRTVTIGDINGDSKLDILTTNYSGGSVSILLGDGGGLFADQTIVTIGETEINDAALADIDGNGFLDIVTANGSTNDISIILGDGNMGFLVYPLSLGESSSGVSIGDLNSDGVPDIVVSNAAGDKVTILVNYGDGSFDIATMAVGDYPYWLALGDIDKDGLLDIVTANYHSNNVSVLNSNQELPVTPEEAINALMATVKDYNLQKGVSNSLNTKLQNAMDSLSAANAHKHGDTINKLQAFINACEAQRGKKLTIEQATNLIASANAIIELIQ